MVLPRNPGKFGGGMGVGTFSRLCFDALVTYSICHSLGSVEGKERKDLEQLHLFFGGFGFEGYFFNCQVGFG